MVIGVVLAALMVVAPPGGAPAGRLPRQPGGRPVWRGGRLRRAVGGRVATVGPGRRVCLRGGVLAEVAGQGQVGDARAVHGLADDDDVAVAGLDEDGDGVVIASAPCQHRQGPAGPAIAAFSIAHHITGPAAWTAALVMMALADVTAGLVTVWMRGRSLAARAAPGRRGTCPGRRRRLSEHRGPRSPDRPGKGAADRGAFFMPPYGLG